MPNYWEPGTQYNDGDVVEYEGKTYKIIQPHRSQSDWAPDQTPALWGHIQGGHQGGHHGRHHEQQQEQYGDNKDYQQGGNQSQGYGQQDQQQQQQPQQSWASQQFEEHKTAFEIGGGVLAGVAALGAGTAAYQYHKNSQENQQAQNWAQGNWLSDAQARTDAFRANGPRGPYTWVLTKGKNIPQGAIEGGKDSDGSPLYVARTYHEGGVHPGKAGRNLRLGAVIGYGGKEIEVEDYEILLGDPSAVRWVQVSGNFSASNLGGQPVEGGKEKDGTTLYLAQAPVGNSIQLGKTNEGFRGAVIPYGGSEKIIDTFRTLVLA